MKLFFDENLSPRLVDTLTHNYPESTHVRNENLRGADDTRIWNYCKENDFVIVSKDTDFRERSFMEGHPPKIIWLDVGNAGTGEIAELMQQERLRIKNFIDHPEASLLILSIGENAV